MFACVVAAKYRCSSSRSRCRCRCTTVETRGRSTTRLYLPLVLLFVFWAWTPCKTPALPGAAAAAAATASPSAVRAAPSGASGASQESETLPVLQRHVALTSPERASSEWVLFEAGKETTKAAVRTVRSSTEPERGSFLAGAAPAEPRATAGHSNGRLSPEKKVGQPTTVLPSQKVPRDEQAPAPAPPTAADAAASAAAADALKSTEERPLLQPAISGVPGPLYTRQAHDPVRAQPSSKDTARPLKSSPRHQQQRPLRESGPLAGVFRAFQQLAAAAASAAGKGAAEAGGSRSNLQKGSPPPAQQQLSEKQQHDQRRQQGAGGFTSTLKKKDEVWVQSRQTQQHLQKQQPQQVRLQSHPFRIAPRIRDWLLQGVRMRHAAEAAVASDKGVLEASPRAQVRTGLSSERPKETDLGTSLQAACEVEVCQRHLSQSRHQPVEVQHQSRQHQQELAAACTWGIAAAWLVHVCFTLGSPIAAAAGDAAASPAGAAGDEGVAGKCHCARARQQVLLREVLTIEPQRKAEQQQTKLEQLQPQGAQLVTVLLRQRHLLLCCTRGFTIQEDSQLVQAGRVPASGSVSNDTADAAGPAVSAAAAAAFGAAFAAAAHAQPQTADMRCRSPSPLQEFWRAVLPETSQAAAGTNAASHHVSTATQAAATTATAEFAENIGLVSSDKIFSESPEQQSAADTAGLADDTALTAPISLQLQRQQEQQQRQQLQDGRDETLDKPTGGVQEAQQLLQQQHQHLSSQWRGHLVFWTWRRSCMRQQQARPTHATVTAAAAAAAAAVCYRQQTTKSLALQLLLLLLPHDLAVRLITERDPAQCQQQPPLQPQQQQEQQPSESVIFETSKSSAPHLAADGATCRVPALELGRSSTCVAAHREGSTLETIIQPADKLQQTADEHEDDKPRNAEPSSPSDDEQLGKQKHRDDGKQQQVEQHQPAGDAALNEFDLKQDKEKQQQHQQPQQVDEVQPKAASAVGGYPGAPQLYGREFVRGTQLTGSFLRLHFNFASLDAGARIVASSPGMQHVKAAQRPDGDTYMLVPCSVPIKYFVLSFAETLKIEFVAFQSLEIYANAFWHIQLLGADTYPSRQWRLVANLQTAADASSELFSVKPECSALGSCWARFLKVRLLTHHDEGSHYYCSLTSFQVFGATAVQVLETHLQDELGGESTGLGADADEGAGAADALAAAATAAVAVRVGGDNEVTTRESDSALHAIEASAGEWQQPPSGLRLKKNEDEADTRQLEQHQKCEQPAASGAHLQQAEQKRPTPLTVATSKARQEAGNLDGNVAGDASAEGHRSSHNRTAPEIPWTVGAKQKGDGTAAAVGDPFCSGQLAEATLREAGGAVDSKLAEAAQHQQHQLLLLLKERPASADAEQQTAAAVNALSAALEEAVQQQRSLLLQRRQQLSDQQLAALQLKGAAGDALWVEVPDSVMSQTDVHDANTGQDKTSCMSSSSNATTRWQRYQPLLQPTTRRYICTPAILAAPIHAGVGPNGNAHQETGHLVAVDSRSTGGSSKKSLPAEAASEALQQASAYAPFLNFLMTASPDAPQQQAEILRVLALLLQPPTAETTFGGVPGRDPVGGVDASAAPVGPKDSKGEHVLVTLLERMKSLEGEAAAFRTLAAERVHQMQLQQQQLLHITLLLQLQQQLGSFLFDRLSALDGLLPHVKPLAQLLDESVAAAAAAAEEEEMLQQAGRSSPEAGDVFCRSVDDVNSNNGNSTQQQHHHCRIPLGLPTWCGLWDALQQVFQPLYMLWGGTEWLARHVKGGAVAFAGVLGHFLQQLICKDAELALLQQSCAAASGVTRLVGFAAGMIANAATGIAGFTYKGFSFAAASAAAMWTRLFAITIYRASEPYSAVEFSANASSQSSANLSWGHRLLLTQDGASAQSAESSAVSVLLLLFVLLLLLGAVVLWRLRHGQRVAAAAAGECALLRRSFELLQQQHRLLQQQLLHFEREQELLLLLTANHQSSRSSRLLIQRTKSIGFVADGNPQQRQQQRPHVVPLEIKKAPQEDLADAALVSGKPTSAPACDEARGAQHAAAVESASEKAATPAPSLLRRLSSTFAPRMLLGLSRQAKADSVDCAAPGSSGSSSSVNSGASKISSTPHPASSQGPTGEDRGAQLSPRRPPLRRQDSECQQLLLLQEQQQAEQQHLQLAAAALLPALDAKAIRGLKLQRHTVRQRRVGGAATPVASPVAVGADGHCPALSPAGVREAAALACDSSVVVAATRDGTAAAAKAAPSRTSSSRSSSVYSASGRTESIYKALIKTRISSTPLPSISLLLESAQQRAAMRAGTGHRTSRNAVDRSYSSGSCSSSSGSFVQPATRATTAAAPLRWHRIEYPSIPNTSRAAAEGTAAGSSSYIDCCSSSAADGSNVSEAASHRSRSSSSSRSSTGGIRETVSSRPLLCGAFEGQRLDSGRECSRIQLAWPAAAVPHLQSSPETHGAADLFTRSSSRVAGFRNQRSLEQKSTLSIGHAGDSKVQAAADARAAKATPMNQQQHQQQVVQARRDGRRRRKKRGAS
ncbi:hypothetical protein Esti_004587 [Eimeria stiedai]